ncbi:MAG: homoserine dehydrogenase [Vicinamibacterales bacterium]
MPRVFGVWYNANVGLNSFQTSGNSPGHADRCRVGILGFGAHGAAVARRLTAPDRPGAVALSLICDRRAREQRSRQPDAIAELSWTDRFDDLLASDIDVLIETLPGSEPAVDYVRAALLAGKSVVTGSKQVIAHHGPALLSLAERQGRQLRYEAAVGGAMPLVRTLGESLAGDRVLRIDAVLNATSNAVLSIMEATGCSIDEGIAEACALGIAEADPSHDLDGADAAAKLAIVCALAFGVRVLPAAIETRTTARVDAQQLTAARLRGGRIRQVAHAAYDSGQGRLSAWVAPIVVPQESLLARVDGPQNAAVVSCAHAGDLTVTGRGAGADAIAVAILGDVLTIARDRAAIVPAPVLAPPRTVTGFSDSELAEAV